MTEVIVNLTGSGDWEVPDGVTELTDVLLVGGGGSGGRGGTSSGGGGGAGGVLHLSNVAVTPGELVAYSVGSGGDAVSVTSRGLMGQASVFGTHEALGGGWGGGGPFTGLNGPGGSGGSGGGGMAGATPVDAGNEFGGDGEPGQGHGGGDGVLVASLGAANVVAGGGGGAGSAGQDSSGTTSGAGGAGIDLSSVFGTDVGDAGWFGGGGGGGGQAGSTLGQGGQGGGGDGGNSSGVSAGIPGTGGGGGGKGVGGSSGPGGSGVILIRYFLPDPGTETGTGSTGAPQLLTPLNLFLVSITLPDDPFVDPAPGPATTAPQLLVVRNAIGNVPAISIYDASASGLTLAKTSAFASALPFASTGLSNQGHSISHDGKYLVVSHGEISGSGGKIYSVFDLESESIEFIGSGGDVVDAGGCIDAATSSDAESIWAAHFAAWCRESSFNGASVSARSSFRTAGGSGLNMAIGCNKAGTRAVVGHGTANLHYLSRSGGTITQLEKLANPSNPVRGCIKFSPDDQFVAVYTDRLTVYEVGASALTQVAQSAVFSGPRQIQWSSSGNRIYTPNRQFLFDGSSLTEEDTYSGVRYVAVDDSEAFIAYPTGASFDTLTFRNANTKDLIQSVAVSSGVAWLGFI